ncbi:hypothetical protein [Phyllobacterium zundukense]|uniref:Uncharacterized protein n=1 Tax=Phyllobacterium zundukense TaxID=1867719 RepID=A0ACD4CVW1_9HYPH|nr:hypothetical protein [Phyllobacterium zundukense]UXN57732.1 hypothetical protein N8E88_02670 [Phyllobacterium zundukense]
MAKQETSYGAIVRAEIAIEVINQARAIVTARVYEFDEQDPAAAQQMRERRRELIDLQQRIRVDDHDAVETVIAVWGPRVRDEARFWAEF